ncbi:MAG: ATP-binding protein [Actinobacteria bacterium]|nr:ATP-binding protein [Actinomycetota bacterium]
MVTRSFWLERIESALSRRSVVWLFGVRRAGKTVLCRSLEDVEYFDCELPSVRRSLVDPERFFASLRGKKVALDEIHRLPDPSETLKVAADHFPDVRVVATGSSTLAATAKFSDTLTGRKATVWLTPMMSRDLVDFGGHALERRLWSGGIPPFFLSGPDSPAEEFQEWLDSFWARDIQELFRLERRGSFLRFVELLLVHSGGIFEATSYAGPCEVSRTTITNYLAVLEETKIVHVLRPFSTRRATEIVAAPKVYAFDTGFVRHARALQAPRPEDYGRFWEHYVLNEVYARIPAAQAQYWRTKQHHGVDLVFDRRARGLLAAECKWSEPDAEELRGLRALLRAYPSAACLVVTPVTSREYDIGLEEGTVTVTGLEGLIERLSG